MGGGEQRLYSACLAVGRSGVELNAAHVGVCEQEVDDEDDRYPMFCPRRSRGEIDEIKPAAADERWPALCAGWRRRRATCRARSGGRNWRTCTGCWQKGLDVASALK